MGKIIVANDQGVQRTIAEQAWSLMRSHKEQGNTRKGWTYVGPYTGKNGGPTAAPAQGPKVTFVPKEVEEAANAAFLAEKQREAEMISGEPQAVPESKSAKSAKSASPDPLPDTALKTKASASPAKSAEEPSKPSAPPYAGPKDDLAAMEGVGKKAAEVLASIGIHTYVQLATSAPGAINKALKEANLGPKVAQVPAWKQAAAKLAKA